MALVAAMLSLLLVELAVRIAVPGKLKKPMLVIPGAETTVPLSQITICGRSAAPTRATRSRIGSVPISS